MIRLFFKRRCNSMSDNLVVQNLINALNTWNEKLSEIWPLLTTIPQEFKGGGIWNVMVNINYWSSSAYFILCGRSCKNLWLIYRGKEAITRIKIICKICNCQRCCYLWDGVDVSSIQYCSRNNCFDHECFRN